MALALVVAGACSDRLRCASAFMLVGGIGAFTTWLYLIQAGGHPRSGHWR